MKTPHIKIPLFHSGFKNQLAFLPGHKGSWQKRIIGADFKASEVFSDKNRMNSGYLDQWVLNQSFRLPAIFLRLSFIIALASAITVPSYSQRYEDSTKAAPLIQADSPIPIQAWPADGNIVIKGLILDSESSEPIPKVYISFLNKENSEGEIQRYKDLANGAVTDSSGKFELRLPLVELGREYPVLKLRGNQYRDYEISAKEDLSQQLLVLYMRKIRPDRDNYAITREYPTRSILITRPFWSQRRIYLSRAELILAKTTFPFWRLKEKIRRKIDRAIHNY